MEDSVQPDWRVSLQFFTVCVGVNRESQFLQLFIYSLMVSDLTICNAQVTG